MTTQSSELRLRALARLAVSQSPEARASLERAFLAAIDGLKTEITFAKLVRHLEVIETIGYVFSLAAAEALGQFVVRVQRITLEHDESDQGYSAEDFFEELYGVNALIAKAISALSPLRYREPVAFLSILFPLTVHGKDSTRKKALEELEKLAAYDIAVFQNGEQAAGAGEHPQLAALTFLERLEPADVRTYFEAATALASKLLSETMRGATWSFDKVVLSEAPLPVTEGVAYVRRRSILWTIGIYPLFDNLDQRLRLLTILNSATRNARGSRIDTADMIAGNAVDVLKFFQSLVDKESLVIVEKLESYAYWIHYHSPSPAVQHEASRFKLLAEKNGEYQIFKVLIGFEGIFTEWGAQKHDDEKFTQIDTKRKGQALQFVRSISTDTLPEWENRILRYSEVESHDLATFPTFIFFLEKVGELQSELALSLMKEHPESMERFLVPLLRGTFLGGREDTFGHLITHWALGGRHLLQCAYALDGPETFDVGLCQLVLAKAVNLVQIPPITAVMSAAVTGYADTPFADEAQEIFLDALKALTREESAVWIFQLWFRPQTRKLLRSFDKQRNDLVLQNLLFLKEIDYHAEEVLYVIAGSYPGDVIRYFIVRAENGRAQKRSIYEGIPFELHKLDKALAPYAAEAVAAVHERYDGEYSATMDSGARLLKILFPSFPPNFEAALFALVASRKHEDIKFVLAVLRNYEGQSFLARICMEIVEALPADDELLGEVAVVLESTGVVVGEFGFADALEAKKTQAAAWLEAPSEKVKKFGADYINSLETRIVDERARATELLVLRKASYGQYD